MDTYFDPSTEEKEEHCFHTFLNQFGLVKTINFLKKDWHILDLQKSFVHTFTLVHVHLGYQQSGSVLSAYKKHQLLGTPKTFINGCDTKQIIRWVC